MSLRARAHNSNSALNGTRSRASAGDTLRAGQAASSSSRRMRPSSSAKAPHNGHRFAVAQHVSDRQAARFANLQRSGSWRANWLARCAWPRVNYGAALARPRPNYLRGGRGARGQVVKHTRARNCSAHKAHLARCLLCAPTGTCHALPAATHSFRRPVNRRSPSHARH